jgi:transcriptional regulator with XRE-family HTH domain
MQINEKLKLMRQQKGWSQEKLAEKLEWAVNSYRKIERGEAGIKLDKIKQIAAVMGVNVEELVNSDDKTVLNFAENCTQSNLAHCTIYLTETQCAHELERAHLVIEQKIKEIDYLKSENALLKEVIALMKTTEKSQVE